MERLLREEISRRGPISFEQFMDLALYHPEHGYYRRRPHPTGRDGDFFTAAQLQPVFGILLQAALERLAAARTLIDWGAGCAALAEGLSGWRYVAVEAASEPAFVQGQAVVVANELFDALPVRVYGESGEALVDYDGARFRWTEKPRREECHRLHATLDAMRRSAESGLLLILDYGYSEPERELRFPSGSLMSYSRHQAINDVLQQPGEQDITAHVNFSRLEEAAIANGFEKVSESSMTGFLLQAGEEAFERAARMNAPQLKLLLGVAESHRALLFRFEAKSPMITGGP